MRSFPRLILYLFCVANAFSQAARISGKVFNESTKKTVRAEWVVLVKAGQGLQTLKQFDNVSEFDFSDVPLVTNAPYLIRAFYKGVLYSQTIRITEARHYPLDVVVYESTPEWKKITLKVPHMIVARSGNRLEIEQTWNIVNTGTSTFNTSDGTTLVVAKPSAAQVASVTTSHNESIPIPVSPLTTDTSLSISFPFRPGITQIQINYTIPYAGTADWSMVANHPIDEFRLFVTPQDIQIVSPLLNHVHDPELEKQNFSAYVADAVTKPFLVTFSGGSQRAADPSAGTILPGSNALQSKSLTLIPFLIALLLIPLYIALTRPVEVRNKESLLVEIAKLDDLHVDRATDPTYLKKRSELKSALYHILSAEA